MSLLSNAQKSKIRSSIKLVTDTFFVNDVEYLIGIDSVDRFQEDRSDMIYHKVMLKALREEENTYTDASITHKKDGDEDYSLIKLSLNVEDLETLNLINSDKKVIFNKIKDYFKFKGKLYKVQDIRYDGPLDEKDILLNVYGYLVNNVR